MDHHHTIHHQPPWKLLPHDVHGGVCINGAIYYGVGNYRILRFDVRSEKIEFIQLPLLYPTLINYNGKLGGVEYQFREGMKLCILEDAEKQEWSNMTYAVAPEWRDIFRSCTPRGEIHTGEVMMANSRLHCSKPFSVFYYDFERESVRKVEVDGIVDDDFRRVHGIGKLTQLSMPSFTGYFENIRFL